MIINISGPASTGKTSLWETLKQHRPLIGAICGREIEFVPESIREVVRTNMSKYNADNLKDLFADLDKTLRLQFDITFFNYGLYRRLAEDRAKVFICDRGPLDNYIYTFLRYATASKAKQSKYIFEFQRSCNLNKIIMPCVDLHFATSIFYSGGVVEDDGFRPEFDRCFYMQECELFGNMLRDAIKLPSDSDERLVTFFEVLRGEFN